MTCRLVSGDDTLAVALAFVDRGYFVFIAFPYDPEWSTFSPGRFVLARSVEWGIANGAHTFGMGWGEEPYKLTWCDDRVGVGDDMVPLTMEGHAIALYHHMRLDRIFARPWLSPLARCIPARLRRVVANRLRSNAAIIADMQPR